MKLVKEALTEDSSFEYVADETALSNRRKALKTEAYYIEDSKLSKGFTAKKDNKRIVVRIEE